MKTVGTQSAAQDPGREVFAMTDEQILEIDDQGAGSGDQGSASGDLEEFQDAGGLPRSLHSEPQTTRLSGRDDNRGRNANSAAAGRDDDRLSESGEGQGAGDGDSEERGIPHSADSVRNDGLGVPPRWLAERMRDPWHGDEAKELWEGAVQARQEAADYREAIATPAEARAFKAIYPGGVNEAKVALERARQLVEFDAAYFGAAGRPADELSAARVQLAQRLMEQDPGAFREMVAAGIRLLEGRSGKEVASGEWGAASKKSGEQRPTTGDREDAQDAGDLPRSLRSEPQTARLAGREDSRGIDANGGAATREVAGAYVNFEKAANADLEKSVGGAIARAMENALPNLKSLERAGRDGIGQGTPLPERLRAAVREEVEAALKSDAALGEQVARILGGRRFDDGVRAQVVRVIDARAQQLVPGAVKRVVGSWTAATLGARGKNRAVETGVAARNEMTASAAPRAGKSGQSEKAEGRAAGRTAEQRARGLWEVERRTDFGIVETKSSPQRTQSSQRRRPKSGPPQKDGPYKNKKNKGQKRKWPQGSKTLPALHVWPDGS